MRCNAIWGPAVCLAAAVVFGCSRSPQLAGTAVVSRAVEKPAVVPPPVIPDYAGALVELSGTGEQIGAQHGKRLAPQIELLHEKYLKVYLGSGAHRYLALGAAQLFESYFPSEDREEVAALAQQTRMSESEAVLAQCFLDLSPMTACSTITLPASAAPDHVARFGRNLDFPSLHIADQYSTVFVYHPRGRYAFASIGWPGMIGVLSGMNEHGLSLANMEITRRPRLPGAMPYTLLYRTILEKCRTVSEAIALLQTTPRQTGNNLMLMDSAGDRAVIEIQPDSISVRRAADDRPLISTNHQRGADCDTAGRCWRYDALHWIGNSEFGRIDLKEVESMLARVSPGANTLQSMVFEPASRTIYLSTGQAAASGTFYRLDLKRYFAGASGLTMRLDHRPF